MLVDFLYIALTSHWHDGPVIVLVAPGQGSQTPGFLAPWIDDPESREYLEGLSVNAAVDLVAHGTVSDADTIRDTAVAQPLIVAAGLLTARALFRRVDQSRIQGVAGHSVGELTAAALAGILSDSDAVGLVAERGRAMSDAASATPTGMSAVLGGDETEVLARLTTLGLDPANFNVAGQIVAAGALDSLAELAADPPVKARVMPLQVAGAFHTHYMAPAVARLREAAAGVRASDPSRRIWTNFDGSAVDSGSRFLELVVGQVSSPVHWDLVMASLSSEGVTGVIELAPAGALVGLAKRGLKGVPTVAVKTPDDLDAAVALIEGTA